MNSKLLNFLLVPLMTIAFAKVHDNPEANQLNLFKKRTAGSMAVMTTAAGKRIDYIETTTLNRRLIFNEFFMDYMTHFVRERIPERVVHAKGGGAFGYFEVTHDVTDICKARLFNEIGKRTKVAVRFSPVAQQLGGIDTSRDSRGFAIKFYTEDGNFDLVGLNTPMFSIKDPILFPTLIRVLKKNPATSFIDRNMLWDFLSLQPETLHFFSLVFSDRGIPDGYRRMPGFGIHTFQVVNEHEEIFFVRFHFNPDLGIKNLSSADAKKIAADDPDYNNRDLYRAISNGDFPSWTAGIQVLSLNDVKNADFDVFDVTKVLPLDKYPLRPLGRLVLNKNPTNNFAEIEQLAFCPANLVPGILGAPDKMFEARRLAYRDAENYRLGANFHKIPVNCPLKPKTFTYNRDGTPPVKDNMKDVPNYYPNSFNGPVPYLNIDRAELIEVSEEQPHNFDQTRDLYVQSMSAGEKTRFIENIVSSLCTVTKFIQKRVVEVFALIHPDISEKILEGLQGNSSCYNNYNHF